MYTIMGDTEVKFQSEVLPKMINKNSKIAVLGGGMSNEREVSLRSAKNCEAALHRLGYNNAIFIDVDKNIPMVLQTKQIEFVFLALHGCIGEDGIIQGLLELLEIPYTGTGILGSALAMNKFFTKQILTHKNIPNPSFLMIDSTNIDSLDKLFSLTSKKIYMVKPVASGSSVDVYKVQGLSEAQQSVKKVIDIYGKAMIEEFIPGTEITVGVVENKLNKGNELITLPILELRPKSKAGFYDYEAKYTEGMTDFILPAQIKKTVTAEVEIVSKIVFNALNCHSYARIDMIIDKTGKPFVLEVNTLPGMTDTSDLPAMAKYAGISYDELVEMILHTVSLKK